MGAGVDRADFWYTGLFAASQASISMEQ